jgi:hypothetical protein
MAHGAHVLRTTTVPAEPFTWFLFGVPPLPSSPTRLFLFFVWAQFGGGFCLVASPMHSRLAHCFCPLVPPSVKMRRDSLEQ